MMHFFKKVTMVTMIPQLFFIFFSYLIFLLSFIFIYYKWKKIHISSLNMIIYKKKYYIKEKHNE
jgi:hypothetical protein